jgi:uncharacterized protein YutE (UPF0331/DUF86 family)
MCAAVSSRRDAYDALVSPKAKVEIAREHLAKAQEELNGDYRDAIQWAFASLEAAIDALAAEEGIAIDQQHWKRTDAARELHQKGVLPSDLSDLHRELNLLRKAIFYDGEELEEDGFSVEDAVVEVETVVEVASERAS